MSVTEPHAVSAESAAWALRTNDHVSREPKIIRSLRSAIGVAERQLDRLVSTRPDAFPIHTVGGRWHVERAGWTNWTDGFLAGQLWIVAGQSTDATWRERAERYTRLLESRKLDRDVHDLGFLFWPTWKRWYDLTGDPAKQQVIVAAGRTMGLRYMPHGRYLRSFVAPNSCFIDIMMNVGIVLYAGQQAQDPALVEIAHAHARTTRRYLVRGDGSTAHEARFDLRSGRFIRTSTHQGWRSDSSWARGQAWALYGFGTMYALSGERAYLETAEHCAAFFLERTLPPGIPPNDWEEPTPDRQYESSAAAIAASGLLQLSALARDASGRDAYRQAALAILEELSSPRFLVDEATDRDGILLHGTYHERRRAGVDESVMWGDYFFLEAIERVLSTRPISEPAEAASPWLGR